MKCLSKSVALALPADCHDLLMTTKAVEAAKDGKLPVEVRIGVGRTSKIPVRVLGYAACVASTLADVRTLVGADVSTIEIFSSAPKTTRYQFVDALNSLTALGGALRICGVQAQIRLELAAPMREIPTSFNVILPDILQDWVGERESAHEHEARMDLNYALEHAAESMFGDLDADQDAPLRITIGGAAEARFWAVRMQVRRVAQRMGFGVAPAVGLILKSLKLPWYQPMKVNHC